MLAIARHQLLCTVRGDVPKEVVQFAIERGAKALHEATRGVRIIDAILERQLAVVQQRIESAGRTFGEPGQHVGLPVVTKITKPAELVDEANRHLLGEVLIQEIQRPLDQVLLFDVAPDVLEKVALSLIVLTT